MAAVNPLLYNAAFAGYLGGMFSGQNLTDATATDYNNAVLQAKAYATAIDIAIGTDTSITTGGAAIVPTTGQIQELEIAKPQVLQAISAGVSLQRFAGPIGATPFTPTDFSTPGSLGATIVAAVKALYTQALTALLTP